jgi:putative tricarboxylic transport membrane protein
MFLTKLGRAVGLAAVALPLMAFTPENTECIAPANPGGGWDFTCRTVGKLLVEEKLLANPMQVTNMPGGVGAVAFANVAGKRSDDPNLIVAASTVGITQIAQNKYPAGVDTMRWVAMLGADVGIVMVNKESEIKDLKTLLEMLKKDPTSVVAGGSSGVGGWDHLRLLLLAKKAGMPTDDLKKIRWVQYSGGSDAVTQLMGKHIGVVLTDIGEIAGFLESGDVRPLATMSDDRLPAFKDLPTAKEQGYDVTGYNWRGFYMPGKVSDEQYQAWVDMLGKLYKSDAWQQEATAKGLTLIWRGGKEFDGFVRQSEADMRDVSKAIGVIK